MYRFCRTAQPRSGRGLDATKLATETTAFINAKYAPLVMQAYTEMFGQLWRLHWYIDFPDLAAFEKFNDQLATDEGYWAILRKLPDVYVDGSVHDTLIRLL